MNLHTSPSEGPPCAHMEGLLQKTAEGSANRFLRWYALTHVGGCTHCRTYLERLEETIQKLHEAKNLEAVPEDAMERLRQGAWRTIQ